MKSEEGVTLIELIIALGILVIVISAVASSMITGLRVTSETQQRISESREAQIASAYFVNDVQTSVTVTVTDHSPYHPCDGAGPNRTPLVSLEGASHDAAGKVTGTVVTYVIIGDSPGARKLDRLRCIKPGLDWQNESDRTVITSLSDAPNDDVICEPTADCSGSVQKININLEVCGKSESGNCVFDAAQRFRFTLRGTRRPT